MNFSITTPEIYKLAETFKVEEVYNGKFENLTEDQEDVFESMIEFGDSKELALATALACIFEEPSPMYKYAYES